MIQWKKQPQEAPPDQNGKRKTENDLHHNIYSCGAHHERTKLTQNRRTTMSESNLTKTVENSNTIYYTILTEVLTTLQSQKPARSRWERAVTEDAEEMISEAIANLKDTPDEAPRDLTALTAELLKVSVRTLRDWGGDDGHNGIRSLYQCAHKSSWGGSHLCNYDIARHYCTPSELKRSRDGQHRPNAREEWLDVQARAIYQALSKIRHLWSIEAGKNRIR